MNTANTATKAQSILHVDDEPSMRAALQRSLRPHGYQVVGAGNAAEAVSLLGEHDFDAAILDIYMPVTNGLVLLERLRELAPDLPVIMLTGVGFDWALFRSVKSGCDGFLEKPFETEDLLAQLEAVIRRNVASPKEALQ